MFQHHSNQPIFLPQHQEAKDETTASEVSLWIPIVFLFLRVTLPEN